MEEDECGVKCLHHADDITLMDELANDLQALIMKSEHAGKKLEGLKITTKLMAIYIAINLWIHNGDEVVDRFCHLVWITDNNGTSNS